jgi:hypothetical protein
MAEEVKVTSKSTNSVDILGLDDVNADLDVTLGLPQPLKTDSKASLELKPLKADLGTTNALHIDPLTTDSSLSVDLKPAVVDLCLTLNVGKLPNVCIRQPYHHHIGFTLWGTEVWGYTFTGEQETVIQEQRPQPKVALGAAGGWTAPPPTPRPEPEPPTRESGGLRIRLGP